MRPLSFRLFNCTHLMFDDRRVCVCVVCLSYIQKHACKMRFTQFGIKKMISDASLALYVPVPVSSMHVLKGKYNETL